MLAVEIDNPEIENIFASKFDSNKNKLAEFIISSLQNFANDDTYQLGYVKKDPKNYIIKNSIQQKVNNEGDVGLYEHINNSAEYVHNLRRK